MNKDKRVLAQPPSLTLQGEVRVTPGVLYSCRQVTGQALPLLRIRASPQVQDPGKGLLGAWPGLLPRLILFKTGSLSGCLRQKLQTLV